MSNSIRVRADVFPASVQITSPDKQPQVLDKVRVVVTMDTVYVYRDSASGPTLAFTERLADFDPGNPPHRRTFENPARPASLTTDSGVQLTYTRSAGCGCGSRLKSFNPFATVGLATVASSNDR